MTAPITDAEIAEMERLHGGTAPRVICAWRAYGAIPGLLSRLRAAEAERDALRATLIDARAALRYIRTHHGELYGVGWDRVEQAATSALSPSPAPEAPDA